MRAAVVATFTAAALASYEVLTVCKSAGTYDAGDMFGYSLSGGCQTLSLGGSQYGFKYSSFTRTFTVYSSSSACTFSESPLKTTTLTSSCTNVLPASASNEFMLATQERVCFPKSCTSDTCSGFIKSTCATAKSCAWNNQTSQCMNACYAVNTTAACAALGECTTDGARCFSQLLNAVAQSAYLSLAIVIAIVVGACCLSVLCLVLLICACRPRNNVTRVELAAPQYQQAPPQYQQQYQQPQYQQPQYQQAPQYGTQAPTGPMPGAAKAL